MRYLVAIFLGTAQALALAAALPAYAEEPAAEGADTALSPLPIPAAPEPAASTEPEMSPASPADDVVAFIRAKLADPDVQKAANADDLAALVAFYQERSAAPLWITDMGFSARAQQVLFEIEKAEAWGIDKAAFDLPPADQLPQDQDEQALAEIRLNFAILQYARFARGGRFNPADVGGKVYQAPPVRDPAAILIEIEAAEAPDAYLRSLHPKHEQFLRLRQALHKAREGGNVVDIKRILINMERWRWMPEDLGSLYVWSNTPEYMLYVVKDGERVYADKTQVGTIGYATPVFSANMKSIVFNPEWIAPPTVLRENLLPALRKKNFKLLKKHGFSVSYQGTPVDVTKVDWRRVNILDYTFTQRPGPHSNVGKVKFLMPNRHAFVLHDTWPERRKYFKEAKRAIGHDCVRMERPVRFAEVVLAEGNGWPATKVTALWDDSHNATVALDRDIPVHVTYFTAVVDETGKVATYDDLYGLDHKLAMALFGDAAGFPMPAPETQRPKVKGTRVDRTAGSSDISRSLHGFTNN